MTIAQNLLNQFYLDKYSSMTFLELVKELNHVQEPNRITKCLIISTRIVFYLTQLIGGNGFKRNLDLQTSTAMSIVLRRLKNDEPIKYEEIENIVKTEVSFISNFIYNKTAASSFNIEGYYDGTEFEDLLLFELKKELLSYVPDNLKLSMYSFIKTSLIKISNYSEVDRYLFNMALEMNGYEVDLEARNHFFELETVTEKAIFLQLLKNEQPSLFILFTSLKSLNQLVLLAQYESLNLPPPIKLLTIFEDLANRATELAQSNYDLKAIPKSINKLSQELVNDENLDMLDLMNRTMDKLYSSFEEVAEGITRQATVRGNLPLIAGQLSKEVTASTQFINNVQKISKKLSKN